MPIDEPFDVSADIRNSLADTPTLDTAAPEIAAPTPAMAGMPNLSDIMRADITADADAKRKAETGAAAAAIKANAHITLDDGAMAAAISGQPLVRSLSEDMLNAGPTPVPAAVVAADRERFKMEAEQASIMGAFAKAPQTARWASMLDNAAYVRHDAEALGRMEDMFADPSAFRMPVEITKGVVSGAADSGLQMLQGIGNLGRGVQSNAWSEVGNALLTIDVMGDTPSMRKAAADQLRRARTLTPMIGEDSAAFADLVAAVENGGDLASVRKLADARLADIASSYAPATDAIQNMRDGISRALAPTPGAEGWMTTQLASGLGSMVPYFATGILGRAVKLGGALTYAGAATQGVAEAYDRAIAAGMDPTRASIVAQQGLLPGALQALSFEHFMMKLPIPARSRWATVARDLSINAGAEGAVEALGQIGQNLIQQQYDPSTGTFDGALAAAGLGGGAAATLRGLMFAFLPGARHTLFHDIERQENARDVAATFKALQEGVAGSELAAKVPEKLRAWAAFASDGTPAETVYVSAEGLQTLAQSAQGMEQVVKAFGSLPGMTPEHIKLAIDTGADIEIPMSTWITDVLRSDTAATLLPHVRLDPRQLTAFEAKAAATELTAQFKEMAARTAALAEGGTAEPLTPEEQARLDVFDEVRARIAGAGRPAQEALDVAAQYAAAYTGFARRSGLTVQEFSARYPLPDIMLDGVRTPIRPEPAAATRPLPEVMASIRAAGDGPLEPYARIVRSTLQAAGLDPRTMDDDQIIKALGGAIDPAAADATISELVRPDGLGIGGMAQALDPMQQAAAPRAGAATVAGRTNVIGGTDLRGDGLKFRNFFADVTDGTRQRPEKLARGEAVYEPAITLQDGPAEFQSEREKYTGNFDEHIKTSIPGFYEIQSVVGEAIVQAFPDGGHMLDIGASEGALVKAIAARTDGKMVGDAMDPNPAMIGTFLRMPQVDGAHAVFAAFGAEADAGKTAWSETDATGQSVDVPFFDPQGQRYDVVHEAMVFQFISNARNAQVARVKELMAEDGVFITEEKFGGPAEQYRANEAKKDEYKARHFDEAQLEAKKAEVLQTGGDAVEGMTDLQVTQDEMETILRAQFAYVAQFWSSGNFKGYLATDSKERFNAVLSAMQPTDSAFAVEATPRVVADAPAPLNQSAAPQRLYHGTRAEFSQFKDGPTFFTSRRGLANEHALRAGSGATGKPRLIEANVQLDNPFTMDAGNDDTDTFWLRNSMKAEAAMAKGHDGIVIRNNDGETLVIATKNSQITQLEAAPRRVFAQTERLDRPNLPIDSDGKVRLHHWSSKERKTIKVSKAGTGPYGASTLRDEGGSVSFYGISPRQNSDDPGTGYVKEADLGSVRHVVAVDPDKLYPYLLDPDGLLDNADRDADGMYRSWGVKQQEYKLAIEAAGYEGYYVHDDGTGRAPLGDVAVLWRDAKPEVVFDERQNLVLAQSETNEGWYYSALTNAVANAKQAQATPKDWLAILPKMPGVKAAEIAWTGVTDWLETKQASEPKRQITREHLAHWLRSQELALVTEIGGGAEGAGSINEVSREQAYYHGDGADNIEFEVEQAVTRFVEDELEQHVDDYAGAREAYDEDPQAFQDKVGEELTRRINRDGRIDDPLAAQVAKDYWREVHDEAQTAADAQAERDYYDNPLYRVSYELTLADGSTVEIDAEEDGSDGTYSWEGNSYTNEDAMFDAIRDHYADELKGAGTFSAQFGEYVEDGGDNYREVLLRVPNLTDVGPNAAREGVDKFANTNHFSQTNIVVHARMTDRVAGSDNILFIEEVQSDLSSDWRKQGGGDAWRNRRPPEEQARLQAALDAAKAAYDAAYEAQQETYRQLVQGRDAFVAALPAVHSLDEPHPSEVYQALDRANAHLNIRTGDAKVLSWLGDRAQADENVAAAVKAYGALSSANAAAAAALGERRLDRSDAQQAMDGAENTDRPFTPFDDEATYALMLKRLLNLAAEEGHDILAWTPGYMQAERWSGAVQNVVNRVQWAANGSGRGVVLDGVNGQDQLIVAADGTIQAVTGRLPAEQVVGRPLSDLIGGPLAARILAEDAGDVPADNIVIGGDGYKIAYDQTMRKFVDKWAKKFGGKVETLDLPELAVSVAVDAPAVAAAVTPERAAEMLTILSGPRWRQQAIDNANEAIEAREFDVAHWEKKIAEGRDVGDALAIAQRALAITKDIAAGNVDPVGLLVRRATANPANMVGMSRAHPDLFGVFAPTMKQRPVWAIRLTPEMKAEAMRPQPLYQGRRGQIVLPLANEAPVITLFAKADPSTLLHEMGHHYLHIMESLTKGAANPNEDPSLRADWKLVNDWWRTNADSIAAEAGAGVTGVDVVTLLDAGTTGDGVRDQAIRVAFQEHWARAFEAYLYEGKSPTIGLRGAFTRFAVWLKGIYKDAKKLNVRVTPEIAGVFERMLASEAELQAARDDQRFGTLSAKTAEELGVDEAAWKELLHIQEQAAAEQEERMLREMMAPIRAKETAEYKAERAATEASVRAEIIAQPVQRAREWLTNGRWLDGDAPVGLPPDAKLNREQLIERYGADFVAALPRGKQTMHASGGVDIDEAAGWFGFGSGDQMVNALMSSSTTDAAVKAEVDARMTNGNTDPLYNGAAEQYAIDAMHGEKAGQLLVAELRALSKAQGVKGKVTPRAAARLAARRTIQGMTAREALRSHVWQAAERKAALATEEALAKGDRQGAFDAKKRQLINHMLYSESRAAAETVAKLERTAARLKRKSTRENLAPDYLEPIDEVLALYEFKKQTNKELDRRGALAKFVKWMTEQGRENELAIPEAVLERAQTINYRQLPMEDLQGVLDTLLNLEHTARFKQRLLNAKDRRDFRERADSIVAAIEENLPVVARGRIPTEADARRNRLRSYLNSVFTASTILRNMDGRADAGAAYQLIKAPIDRATRWLAGENDKLAKRFERLYGVYSAAEQRAMSVVKERPAIGEAMSKWDIISVALNMGNAGNLQRLTDVASRGWSQDKIDKLVGELDRRDWEFVQGMWDLIGSYWPEIAAREKRLKGVEPVRVDPMPVDTKFGTFRGGYYPIVYDSELSARVSDEQAAELMANTMAGKFAKAQTSAGHLETRKAGSGGRPLALGIGVGHRHLARMLHDLAYSEPVTQAWRLVKDGAIREAMQRAGRLGDIETLELWLQEVATGQMVAANGWQFWVRRAKTNFTLSKLLVNLKTVMMQPIGVLQSAVVVGKTDMALGFAKYMRNPRAAAAAVREMSPLMAQREKVFHKDMADILAHVDRGPVEGRVNAFNRMAGKIGFFAMTKTQFWAVDVPTWVAAYDKFRRAGKDETSAIEMADQAVLRAQAGTDFADRSAIERGTLDRNTRQSEVVRLMTTLGSYMFAKLNIAAERTADVKSAIRRDGVSLRSMGVAMNYAMDMTLLFMIETLTLDMIVAALTGDDEDKPTKKSDQQGWAAYLALTAASNIGGGFPVIRDALSVVQGYDGGGAYGSVVGTATKGALGIGDLAAAMVSDEDVKLNDIKNVINGIGLATGLPTTAFNRVIDGVWRASEGKDVAPIEYLFGRRG